MTLLLPATYSSTRDALHRLACYVIAPARRALTRRIGLVPTTDGFGTPTLPGGSRVVVRGDEIAIESPDASPLAAPITTLTAAAKFLKINLSSQPGVGTDLPYFDPNETLAVDAGATRTLGQWYAFGSQLLSELEGDVSDAVIWPEHFDLAVVTTLTNGEKVDVGFSPGDTFSADPYVYVGPYNLEGFSGGFWNAPFGAQLANPPRDAARAFIAEGLERVGMHER
jgi:hypothetical protein